MGLLYKEESQMQYAKTNEQLKFSEFRAESIAHLIAPPISPVTWIYSILGHSSHPS